MRAYDNTNNFYGYQTNSSNSTRSNNSFKNYAEEQQELGVHNSSTPLSDTETDYDAARNEALGDSFLNQPKSFAVLNGNKLPGYDDTKNMFSGRVPYQYKLVPEKKSHRNTSFTIINDVLPNPRSPSPPVSVSSVSGRVSPFRGRGFRPGHSSRHAASPLSTPYPLLGTDSGVSQPVFYECRTSAQNVASSESTTSDSGDCNFKKVPSNRRRILQSSNDLISSNNNSSIQFSNSSLNQVPLKLVSQEYEKNRQFDRLSPIISTAETSPALDNTTANPTKAAFILLDNQENKKNEKSRLGMISEVTRNKIVDQQSKIKENLNEGILSNNEKSITKQRSPGRSILKNQRKVSKISQSRKQEGNSNSLHPKSTIAKSNISRTSSTKNLSDSKSLLTPKKSISPAKTLSSKHSSPKKVQKKSASKKLVKSSSPNNSKLVNEKNKSKFSKKFVPKSSELSKKSSSPHKNVSKTDMRNRSGRKSNKNKTSSKSNGRSPVHSNDTQHIDRTEMENQFFFRNETGLNDSEESKNTSQLGNTNKGESQEFSLSNDNITQENNNSNSTKNLEVQQTSSNKNSDDNNEISDTKLASLISNELESMTDNVISITTETVTAPLHIEAPRPQIPPTSVENLLAKKVIDKPHNDSKPVPSSTVTNANSQSNNNSLLYSTTNTDIKNRSDLSENKLQNQNESNSNFIKDVPQNVNSKTNKNKGNDSQPVNNSTANTTHNNLDEVKQQNKEEKNQISTNHTNKNNNIKNLDQVTIVSEKVKPIQISVKEKAAELDVQSGNINRSPSNGTLSSSIPRTVSSEVPQLPNSTKENENTKKSLFSRLCSCFKTPVCSKCCRRQSKQSETSTKVKSGICGKICSCCKKDKPLQFKPKRETLSSGASSSGKNKEKILENSGCCMRLRNAICCSKKRNKVKRIDTNQRSCCSFLRCCMRKRNQESWADRRDSILSDVPSSKRSCCPKWNCWPCRKKVTVKEKAIKSRSTSMLNKKKSLTPTTIQQPEKKIPVLDDSLVEHTSEMKGAIPVLPIPLAWLCLILNCILPGGGTIMSGIFCLCFGKPRFSVHDNARLRIGSFIINIFVGIAQLFCVVFCLVGWGWSIWWGTIMLKVAKKHKKFKEMEQAENAHRSSIVNQNPGRPDVEPGRK